MPPPAPREIRHRRTLAAAALALLLVGAVGCAGSGMPALDDLLAAAGTSGESRLVAGLKQALEVGTERAVASTSRADGYLGNPAIRIRLPDSLETMGQGLRAVGFGSQVDELEVAMNRAAEQASAEATGVFWDAIRGMSFSDAQGILDGSDTAATEYFERKTREPLGARFRPIVAERMRDVGLVELYQELASRYAALPFTQKPALDLEGYVTDRSLDGLFQVLGDEEKRIREDPAARTTALLKEVFGP